LEAAVYFSCYYFKKSVFAPHPTPPPPKKKKKKEKREKKAVS